MTPRRKQHHTLSDLLADDVRDYFLREGVPSSPPRPSGSWNQRRASARSSRENNRANNSNGQDSDKPRRGTLPPNLDPAAYSPLRMEKFDEGDAIIEEKQSSDQSTDAQSQQQRGQDTAESPTFDRSSHSRNSSGSGSWQKMQQHRRHSSGSGSFNSRGSNSSRFKRVSAADAEFLRRYAEERERTNMRMQAFTPAAHPPTEDLSPPKLAINSNFPVRPYHGFALSPRPPTVAGSHRPGLPSIDNDDWEEDDRIEYKDRQKRRRREARMRERHRRKQSSIDGSIGGSSFVRQATGGSVNDTMEYSVSTASGSHFLYPSPIQSKSKKESKKQSRHVRPLSYLSASSESGGEAGETSQEESRENESREDDAYFTRPSPPPHDRDYSPYSNVPQGNGMYMSGNDSYSNYRLPSGNDSYYSRQTTLATPDYMFTPSPVASYNMGVQKFSDSSTLQSSLRGSSIYSAASSRERSYETGWTTNESSTSGGRYSMRSPAEQDEESSEGSYDSYDSDESSYTSDSYYSDSSSSSSNQWERVANSRRDYRNADTGRRDYRDIERGRRDERQILLNKGNKNYSSVRSHHQMKSQRKNRHQKHRRRHRQEKLRGPPLRLDDAFDMVWKKLQSLIVMLELLISNMPSLIGSLALAWTSLGIDWFKWYEETAEDCIPTDYHNEACIYPEFPGCFACDTSNTGYRISLNFHYLCSTISFVLASCLIGKILIAFPVVRDELANPTTAAPLGLLCMALDKCFAGNFGAAGAVITFLSAALQTTVAIWFIFISVVYKTLPEPSWFPNTTGIGLAAVKMYLYWAMGGYILSGVSLVAFFMFYFVSLYRLHTNEKISAVVCWLQLSGPAVVLYGYTIFTQPRSDEDEFLLADPENKLHFFDVHRKYYMPLNHILFASCMISMVSALYCLKTRWASFRAKEFSPAHVGFCAPLASHANALQAYRGAVNKYSLTPPDTLFKKFLYQYWFLSLICGTVLTVILTFKFLRHLPRWCQIDVEDDEIPPPPDDTILTRLLQKGEAADEMNQHFVSAAVLQANESGALVRVLRDGKMKYVRSRRMPSMGFDPIMNTSELVSERDRLIQHISYAAQPSLDRGGMTSFDDAIREFQEPDRLRASSRRNKLNFMSFDAATMMRGDFEK